MSVRGKNMPHLYTQDNYILYKKIQKKNYTTILLFIYFYTLEKKSACLLLSSRVPYEARELGSLGLLLARSQPMCAHTVRHDTLIFMDAARMRTRIKMYIKLFKSLFFLLTLLYRKFNVNIPLKKEKEKKIYIIGFKPYFSIHFL
jgi:hypothetical protein